MLICLNQFLRGKGQGIVEYAVLLAFIVAVAAYLLGNGGLKEEVSATFSTTTSVLGATSNN